MSCPHCRRATGTAAAPDAGPRKPPISAFRRRAGRTGWFLPGILLVFIPKCPLCLAAYIALATGATISATTAAWLRWLLIVACVAALGWAVIKWSLSLYRRIAR